MPLFPQNTESQSPLRSSTKKDIPAGLWIKCKGCDQTLFQNTLDQQLGVCPLCGYHYPMTAWKRIQLLADQNSFQELDKDLVSLDPLQFAGDGSYPEKLTAARSKTGLNDAIVTGNCTIDGISSALGVMDFRFMGASMGSVVGEKITRLVEQAVRAHRPVVLVTASGGARMHEGVLSLMQMAKTSGALKRLDDAGLPCIILFTNPTTGGVTASFASLGDVILAEPGAMIGFAGPRVIKETTKAELPEGFQTAEFLLKHGFVDRVVPRKETKQVISQILHSWSL